MMTINQVFISTRLLKIYNLVCKNHNLFTGWIIWISWNVPILLHRCSGARTRSRRYFCYVLLQMVCYVIILTFSINKVDAAFYNFLSAVVFLMIRLVASVGMTQSKFYHFYAKIPTRLGNQINDDQPLIQTSKSSTSIVTSQIWI